VWHRAGVPRGVAHNPSTTLAWPTTPRGHNLVVKELQRWLAVNCGLAENVKLGDARPKDELQDTGLAVQTSTVLNT
jgi:hypothetical protein